MAKISIITICYNSEKTISKTLKSLKSQTFKDFEHIVIDGGSIDKTISIIKKANISNKVISEKDKGIYDAFNKGIINSTGEIIGFLNADDIFNDIDSLEKIVKNFGDKIDCVFGDLIYTDKENKVKRIWRGSPFINGSFKKGWMPAHPTFYCKRKIYQKFGVYDDSYQIAGDFELMMRFLEKQNIYSKYIPVILINMKIGGISNKSLIVRIKILIEEFKAFKQNKINVNKIFYILMKAKKLKEFKFFHY